MGWLRDWSYGLVEPMLLPFFFLRTIKKIAMNTSTPATVIPTKVPVPLVSSAFELFEGVERWKVLEEELEFVVSLEWIGGGLWMVGG